MGGGFRTVPLFTSFDTILSCKAYDVWAPFRPDAASYRMKGSSCMEKALGTSVLRVAAVSLALICLFCASALAEYPVDPYHAERQPFPLKQAEEETLAMRGAPSVIIPEDIQTGAEVQFQTALNGGATPPCTYRYTILSVDPHSEEVYGEPYLQYNYVMQGDHFSDSEIFPFTFYAPGEYRIWIDITDAENNSFSVKKRFQVSGDDLLAEKLAEIAAECLLNAATDYEKAIWLHDWLIGHADYDALSSRYTTEGVIMHGFGVCDSYRHAYVELLNLVDVPATAVTSAEHAWNLVSLEGDWYNVDCTWDDLGAGGSNDVDTHLFFGLPDALIHRIAEHSPDRTPNHACDSYTFNYALYSGRHQLWTEAVLEAIQENNDASIMDMWLDLDAWYQLDETLKCPMRYPLLYYGITAYVFSQREWSVAGYPVDLLMEYDYAQPLRMRISEVSLPLIVLPEALREIGPEAFADAPFQVVVIPDGCVSIGSRAFANCGKLRQVSIPNTVADIAEDSFEDAGDFLLVTPAGSAAAQYAQNHGIRLREE